MDSNGSFISDSIAGDADAYVGNLGPWSITSPKPTLRAKWITRASELEPGLLFYADQFTDVFGSDPQVAVTASLVTDHESYKLDTDFNVELMLLVTGFKMPAPGDELWNFTFMGEKHTRGSERDGNLREVYEYVGHDSGLPVRAGLTVHSGRGSWSSWPAHEFETQSLMAPVALYPNFQEVFAFITDPMGMWGIQVNSPARTDTRYDAGIDAFVDKQISYPVLGAHPVVAAPGTRLAYLWCYEGGLEKFVGREQH